AVQRIEPVRDLEDRHLAQPTAQDRDDFALPSHAPRRWGCGAHGSGRWYWQWCRAGWEGGGLVQGCLGPCLNRGDKAIAVAPQGLNQPLVAPTVAQNLAHVLEAVFERCVTDEVLRPDVLQQLLLGHHPVTVFHQVEQYLKHFRAELLAVA